jgi:cytochrome c oxidase subunit 3
MSAAARPLDPASWREHTAALGMWVFLATEVMFFGAIFLGYLYLRAHNAEAVAAASRHTHEWLGTINTAILLTSSFSMALAVRFSQLARRKTVQRLLWVTAALGAAFLAVKFTEYTLEWKEGLVPGLHFTIVENARVTALFFFLYFVATGVHAVHLTIGVLTVLWLSWRLREPRFPDARADEIEVLGLYWHFVDAIWIFLYPLFYLVSLSS